MTKIEGKGVINWKVCSVIVFVIFVQQLVCAILYADLPYIIQQYFPDMDSKQIGVYAGWVISLYNLGQLPGCLYWGWHADKYGRKQPLIIITLANAVLMFGFGLCTRYSIALVIRIIWGIMDGYLSICKTILSEVCSPDMLPVTTGLVFFSMALANTCAPLVGGYLSHPEVFLSGLIKEFPYLMKVPFFIPFALSSICCLLCTLFVFLWVDETLPKEERNLQQAYSNNMKKELSGVLRKKERKESLDENEAVMVELSGNNYIKMFKDKLVVITVSMYALEGLIQTSYDTVLSVWLASTREVGGFSLLKEEVGVILSCVSPLQVSTLLLFPFVSRVCKTTKSYLLLSTVQVLVLFFTPAISVMNSLPIVTVYALLYIVISLFNIIRSILFNAVYVLIANSCYPEFRAKAYSLSQVLVGLLRFVGPTLLPMVYSWSISSKHPFPLDYGLCMYILGFLSIFCVVLTWLLPDEINDGKGSLYDGVRDQMEKRKQEKSAILAADEKTALLLE